MDRFFRLVVVPVFLFMSLEAFCCTSVILSGNARPDGKPLMLKHRDSDEMNVRMQWFQGSKYPFIGLVNKSSKGGEVWAGTNSKGFCIMNTATYDLKDDDVPQSMMDKEGILMYNILGVCASLDDFEKYLDSLEKPWGVEANFGIIDASGEAAYYEVNNHSWKRFDVAGEPGGYMVVTNFTRTGRVGDRKGVDRYEKASLILRDIDVSKVSHKDLFNRISRSGKPVMRDISSCSVVFEGVAPGEDPLHTTMWTILGCPSTCIYVPLRVFERDHIPFFMKENKGENQVQICDQSLVIKGIYGYDPGCSHECRKVEEYVDANYSSGMNPRKYDRLIRRIYRKYKMMYKRKLPKVSF